MPSPLEAESRGPVDARIPQHGLSAESGIAHLDVGQRKERTLMLPQQKMVRGLLSVVGAGLLLSAAAPAFAGTTEQQEERHFTVKDRPMVIINNIVNGRIEVKSWKNHEVVVTTTMVPGKVAVDAEQVGDRIDINASSLVDGVRQPHKVEANFQLLVPEQTELQLRTQTGLILVEQVNGDMKLQSVA